MLVEREQSDPDRPLSRVGWHGPTRLDEAAPGERYLLSVPPRATVRPGGAWGCPDRVPFALLWAFLAPSFIRSLLGSLDRRAGRCCEPRRLLRMAGALLVCRALHGLDSRRGRARAALRRAAGISQVALLVAVIYGMAWARGLLIATPRPSPRVFAIRARLKPVAISCPPSRASPDVIYYQRLLATTARRRLHSRALREGPERHPGFLNDL